jgi:hypothetical protein
MDNTLCGHIVFSRAQILNNEGFKPWKVCLERRLLLDYVNNINLII